MNSAERHEARYQRRKQAREQKKLLAVKDCFSLAKVMSYENLYKSYRKCRQTVSWKYSTQKFSMDSIQNIRKLVTSIRDGTNKPGNFYEFDIVERGKQRHIRSVHIRERVVQRCICDYSLCPIMKRMLIHDNGATISGKGTSFARNRFMRHLKKFTDKNKNDGYILLFDFSKYFDTISHKVLRNMLDKQYGNSKIKELIIDRIKKFGDVGLGLGSQISQILAVAYTDKLDKFLKLNEQVKLYGRYMDDGYVIHNNKEYLLTLMKKIENVCNSIGIKLNKKKTKIVKLSSCFEFMKIRYFVTDTGKIIKRYCRKANKIMRKRLRKYKEYIAEGKATFELPLQAINTWMANQNRCNAYHTIKSMMSYFYDLFGDEYEQATCKILANR